MKIVWRVSRVFPIRTPKSFRLSQYSFRAKQEHLESRPFSEGFLQEIGKNPYDTAVPSNHSWPDRYAHLIGPCELHLTTGLVYVDGSVVEQSGHFHESAFHTAIRHRAMQPPRNLKELNPEFQFFALPPVLAYWHWIAEILPMLLRLKEIVPEIITVVNNNQPKYVFELLNQIGTKYILTGDDWVKVPQLWLVDKPVFGFYHPTEVDLVRKLVEDLLPHPSREPGPKHKVYISRMGGSRAMNNERQLESWLESNGYFIFRDREIGVFANQVNLFGNADTIIGSTGSGLANAILMPENSRMVELFSSSLDVPEVITLCASINVRHSRIEVKETEDYPFGDGEQIIGQLQLEV